MAKYLKTVLVLGLGLGLAYWFVNRLDWKMVGAHMKNARIWPLVVAAVLINLTMVARSLRWRALLTPVGKARFRNLIAATSMGFGAIFVIGRIGEIVRPAVLSLSERIRPSATLATILIERIFDTAMVVSLFAINLLYIELPASRETDLRAIRTIGLLLVAGLFIGIGILILLRLKARPILGLLERLTARLPLKLVRPVLNFIRHLADGLVVLVDLKLLMTTSFYTICVWSLVSSATWFTLYAFGLKFSFSYIIFILGFGLVGSVAPTPGGSAGAFHAAAAKALEFLGLEPNLAASIAIIHHLTAFGPPFLIALYFLIRDDISLDEIRKIIASEAAAAPQPSASVR